MNFEEIMQLIDKVSASNLTDFEYETETMGLVLKKEKQVVVNTVAESVVTAAPVAQAAASAVETAPVTEDENVYVVKSPIVGTFYASKEEGGEPLVTVGSEVKKDSVVGIIEAMKLMNEITAGMNGVVSEILVENGQLVEYGQEIMRIKF